MRITLLRDTGRSPPCRLLALERTAADAGFSHVIFSQQSRAQAYGLLNISMSMFRAAAFFAAWKMRTFHPPPAGIPLPRRILRRRRRIGLGGL